MGLSTILTDMQNNKKLTINNFEKLKGKWIGPLEVTRAEERYDYYYIEGISNVWTWGHIFIHREVESGMYIKADLRRMNITGITEHLVVKHHISVLEDMEGWVKEMGKMMREGAWHPV
jgi:hypothetical protein